MSSKPIPKPGILEIAPYVGGKSKAAPGVRVVKLSSNENPLGASPKAREAFQRSAESLHRYPDGAALKLRETIARLCRLLGAAPQPSEPRETLPALLEPVEA